MQLDFYLVFLVFLSLCSGFSIVPKGYHAVYRYKSQVKTGVTKPSGHGSFWEYQGNLHIHGGPEEEQLIFELKDSQVGVYSGEFVSKEMILPGSLVPVSEDLDGILKKPWKVQYRNGIATEVDLGSGNHIVDIDNIKRSISSLIQLDYQDALNVWNSKENNIFGTCLAAYTKLPKQNNEIHIRKFIDHSLCKNEPTKHTTFDRPFPCVSKKIESSSSQRLFVLEPSTRNPTKFQMNYLEANGSNLFLPFLKYGNSKYVFVRQSLQLNKFEKTLEIPVFESGFITSLEYQFGPNNVMPIEKVIKRLEIVGETLSINMEHKRERDILSPLDTVILRHWLQAYNKEQLLEVYQQISDRKILKNIMNFLLPSIGTQASLEVVLHFLTTSKDKNLFNTDMLTSAVFFLTEPKEEDFLLFEKYLTDQKFPKNLEKAKILAGSTLLGRVCEVQCRPDLVTKYSTLLFGMIETSKSYEDQLVYLSALSNIGSSKLIDFLGQIIRTHPNNYLRYQAIQGLTSFASTLPQEVESLMWPIFINRTEPIELRIWALNLLLISEPTPGRIIHLHWFIDSQRDPQLYHYYYSQIESFKNRHHPCSKKVIHSIQHVSSFLKTPPSTHWGTSFVATEYFDEELGLGTSKRMISIAASNKIWPSIIYWKTEEWARGHLLVDVEISLRAEGLFEKLLELDIHPTPENIIEHLKKLNINLNKKQEDGPFELVIKKNRRIHDIIYTKPDTILSFLEAMKGTLFETAGVFTASDYLVWLDSFKTLKVSDMGTPVIENYESNFFFSMNYNADGKIEENNVRVFHSFLKSSITMLSSDVLLSFNPFINSTHISFNKVEQTIRVPVNYSIAINKDEINDQYILDFKLHNKKDQLISYSWEANSTTLVTQPAEKVMLSSCPKCKLYSNVPIEKNTDVENADEVFDIDYLGIIITMRGETVDWTDSELFNQIVESIFTDTRILGYLGSPCNLITYLFDHGTIVNLADNSLVQVELEFQRDSEMSLTIQVPNNDDYNNITLLYKRHFIDEENSKDLYVQANLKTGNELLILDVVGHIDHQLKPCLNVKIFAPMESPQSLELKLSHHCTEEEEIIAILKINDNWTVDQKESIWPVEMFETLPDLEDWYNEVNDFDKACKDAWKDQSYNVTISMQPFLEEDVILEFIENGVNLHENKSLNSMVSSTLEYSSKSLYDLIYFDNDLFGLSSQCIINANDIITWDRFQRKWLNHSDTCYSLMVTETTENPQFVIWAKQIDQEKNYLKIKLYADGSLLEIVPKGNGEYDVFNITNSQSPVNIPIQGIYDDIELIHRRGQLIIYTDKIDILTNGKFLYISGNYIIWNQLAGLCGSYDGDPFNDIKTGTYEDCTP